MTSAEREEYWAREERAQDAECLPPTEDPWDELTTGTLE